MFFILLYYPIIHIFICFISSFSFLSSNYVLCFVFFSPLLLHCVFQLETGDIRVSYIDGEDALRKNENVSTHSCFSK